MSRKESRKSLLSCWFIIQLTSKKSLGKMGKAQDCKNAGKGLQMLIEIEYLLAAAGQFLLTMLPAQEG